MHHTSCYAFQWRYCRHWKTWWNIFICFFCRRIFRVIFTSINPFCHTLKICINNKWSLIGSLVLIKFWQFFVFKLFLLIMLMVFLLQGNAIVILSLESLKNNLSFTIWVMFWIICRYSFSFLVYKTLRTTVTLFFSFFFQSYLSDGRFLSSQLFYSWKV